ncbi:MAG TPA: transcription antitermination factor NusB [Bacillota bacterium]|nr:transcription antitermination factor NusB [Bacillota bacterium]
MKRSEARETLMHIVFQMEAQNDCSLELKDLLISDRKIPENHREYISAGFNSVKENLDEIDSAINNSSNNWSVKRMPKTDLAIARVATAEILYMDNIPDSVAINEAVDLAKKYGGQGSSKFINGILGHITRNKE